MRTGFPDPLDVETPKRPSPAFLFVAVVAGIGLALSLVAHISAILGLPQPFGGWTMSLHMGIFPVWIPTIFACRGIPADVDPKFRYPAFFKASPTWARALIFLLFGYAFLNFALSASNGLPKKGKAPLGEEPPPAVVRVFSGHWMLFYGVALATILSAPTSPRAGAM